jgi:hypothetical protein
MPNNSQLSILHRTGHSEPRHRSVSRSVGLPLLGVTVERFFVRRMKTEIRP